MDPNNLPRPSLVSLCASCNEKDRFLAVAADAMTALNKRIDALNERIAMMGDAGHSLAIVVEAARAWRRKRVGTTKADFDVEKVRIYKTGIEDLEAALATLDELVVARGGDANESLAGDGWSDPEYVPPTEVKP